MGYREERARAPARQPAHPPASQPAIRAIQQRGLVSALGQANRRTYYLSAVRRRSRRLRQPFLVRVARPRAAASGSSLCTRRVVCRAGGDSDLAEGMLGLWVGTVEVKGRVRVG